MITREALEKIGAADVVPEHDLSVAWLADYIVDGLTTPGRLARMSAAARSRAQEKGAERLADLVIGAGGGRDGGR